MVSDPIRGDGDGSFGNFGPLKIRHEVDRCAGLRPAEAAKRETEPPDQLRNCHAPVPEGLQPQRTCALAQAGAVGRGDQAQVGVGRARQAEGLLQSDLGGRDATEIHATDNLRDFLEPVVHDDRQVVREKAIPAEEQGIASESSGIIALGPQSRICPFYAAIRQTQAQRGLEALPRAMAAKIRIGPQAIIVVRSRGQILQVLPRAVAGIQKALVMENLEGFAIGAAAIRLPDHRRITFHSQRREIT